MFPILFKVGSFSFYTLGFLVALGFLLFTFLGWRRLRNLGLGEEKIIDFFFLLAFWGLIFSRLGFVLLNFRDFGFYLDRWLILPRYPGLTFWGGVAGGLLVLARFAKKNNWDFWRVADEIVYAFLPFAVLVQLGCFFDGSVVGRPTGMPWGVFFPGELIRRQPVALFTAIFFMALWFFLLKAERSWRSWNWYPSGKEGFIFLFFLGLSLLTVLGLAFLEQGRVYYLWFKRLSSFLAFLVINGLFFKRAGFKIQKSFKK